MFEPYSDQGNGAVATNVWQEDAFDNGDATYWVPNNDATPLASCDDNAGRANRCSISDIQGFVPDATIVGYGFGVNLGSFQPNITANVDALYMSVSGDQSTYDLEEEAGPTGPTGAQGPAGSNGTNGTQGAAGPQGATGPRVRRARPGSRPPPRPRPSRQ